MALIVTISWGILRKDGAPYKPTIYEALRDKLGREPTHAELCADVRRILSEAHNERVAN
jgi:hypothetical protein